MCRDPSLCDVCAFSWNAPGEAIDAYEEAGYDYHRTLELFEAELARKWQEKVAQGRRPRPGALKPPLTVIRIQSHAVGGKDQPEAERKPEQLVMRPEIGAESPLWNDRGHMVWLAQLPLEPELRRRLEDWANRAGESDCDAVTVEGRVLYADLTRQLADRYEVTWDAD